MLPASPRPGVGEAGSMWSTHQIHGLANPIQIHMLPASPRPGVGEAGSIWIGQSNPIRDFQDWINLPASSPLMDQNVSKIRHRLFITVGLSRCRADEEVRTAGTRDGTDVSKQH